MRKTMPPVLAVLIIFIAALHCTAIAFYLYWVYWWFDIMTHFLGGLWIGLFLYWFFYLSGITALPSFPKWAFILAGTIVIGVGWEIFEYALHLTFTSKSSYLLDMSLDLLMDVVGAAVALSVIRFKLL